MSFFQKLFGKPQLSEETTSEIPVKDSLKITFNQTRDKALHHSVCFAPSTNMIFSEDGTIKACCHNKENILGRYPDNNISEIWNSAAARQFRQKMTEYQFLSGCQVCSRDYNLGNFNEMPARHFDELPRGGKYPVMMEFMLTNTCNLECVMCTGELSSSIRKNRDKLPPIQSPYNDEFINQLEEFIPYLTETRFSSSGEAFLIDLNFKLWQLLIERNPACLIVVQTNGTILNARVKDFLERGNFQIGVSLDSLRKETFESIRINASFDRVMESVQYFADYSRKRNKVFTISTCVMRQNWNELPEFIHFCNKAGAVATFHKVWTPLQYSLHNLPVAELQHIYDQLSAYNLPCGSALEKKNKLHYEYFVSVIAAWLTDARNEKSDNIDLQNLTTNELRQLMGDKLKTYITGQTMLDNDKQQLIQLCQDKIDEVMNLCENDQHKQVRLILLCSTPVSISLPAIKTYTAQKLYELSVNQVNQN
jgi:MoaA/NifB/PqqE/SkfB family radical SAM enzyme